MLSLLAFVVAAQVIGPGAPASADPPKVTPASAGVGPGRAKADPNRSLCRSNMATGHHIADRVCHTQDEWDRLETSGKAYVGALQAQQSAMLPAGSR